MIGRLYQLPGRLAAGRDAGVVTEAKAAGLRVGALTNDLTDFHGADWVAAQEH